MVRGGELVREARVLAHAVLDVLRETAGGDQHALRGAHVKDLAGILAAEAIALAGLDADDFLLVVDDDFVDDEAKARLNAEFLELGEHRKNEAGAGVVRHGVRTLDGVAAVVGYGLELDADVVAQPLEVGDGFIGDAAGEGGMAEAAARLHDVRKEKVGGVLDAFLFLHVGAGGRDGAAVDDGVAARRAHLVDEHDLLLLRAEVVRLEGGGAAGKAGADDEKTRSFVPLLRRFGREGGSGDGGGSGGCAEEGAGLEELAAGLVGHADTPFHE